MIALVTGGAGFVGSHLAGALLRDGHSVFCLDDLSTGSMRNVAPFLDDARFRFIEGDAATFAQTFERLDAIFHFASPASPLDYAERPIETLHVNAFGTERCCKLAREHGARLIYASTSEVYGDPLVHPQPETYYGNVNPNGPRSCYDEGKRFGEAVVAAYAGRHSLDARIVRIFNTYGPRMRRCDGRVVPTFIDEALRGLPLTIYGEGTQTRSLCYVDDLVEGIMRYAMIDRPLYTVMNLGSDDERTVLEIAQSVARLCGVDLRVRHQPFPQDDPRVRRPDLTRAREMIQFEPATTLEDGLRATIAWFEQAAIA